MQPPVQTYMQTYGYTGEAAYSVLARVIKAQQASQRKPFWPCLLLCLLVLDSANLGNTGSRYLSRCKETWLAFTIWDTAIRVSAGDLLVGILDVTDGLTKLVDLSVTPCQTEELPAPVRILARVRHRLLLGENSGTSSHENIDTINTPAVEGRSG